MSPAKNAGVTDAQFLKAVVAGGVVFSTRYTPLLDWGGKVIGAMGVATEVTDAYRTALARDEFLSTISHELRRRWPPRGAGPTCSATRT